MKARNLTAKFVENVPAPKTGRAVYPDKFLRGLVLRVAKSGAKSFAVVGRVRGTGVQRLITIGPFPAFDLAGARDEARDKIRDLARGIDPAEKRRAVERKAEEDFTAVFEAYRAAVIAKRRNVREMTRIGNKYLIPAFKGRRVNEIKRRDITALLDKIAERGLRGHPAPGMADHVLEVLSGLFNWWALRDDEFTSPIVRGMRRTKQRERARTRVLNDKELRALWAAADTVEPPAFGSMVKLLMLTAQRLSDWRLAQWSEIKDHILTIPGARYKNGKDHAVPLSDAARVVLAGLPRRELTPFIFAVSKVASYNDISAARARLDQKIIASLGQAPERFTLHDLRRTGRTLMAAAGVPRDHAEQVLGHTLPGLDAVYNHHRYLAERKRALDALAQMITLIVAGKSREEAAEIVAGRGAVVPLARAG